MKRNVPAILGLIVLATLVIRWQTAESKVPRNPWPETNISTPEFHRAIAFASSANARDLAPPQVRVDMPAAIAVRQDPIPRPEPMSPAGAEHDSDGAVARPSAIPMPPPLLSFDGLSNFDNINAYGWVIVPPDITGDVGPDHYVQAVNALVRVFDKSGNAVTPPFRMSQLFAPLGTLCSTRDDGDPIVLYDPLAGRWLLSQFCNNFPPFRQMVAVSKTGDPTGAYFVYEFVMPNVKINDFPKFGVWPDAYLMTTEEFLGSDYAGAGIFAFDRTKMLAGDPTAGFVYVNQPSNSLQRRSNMLPADLDGIRPPPSGTPGIFVSYTATEYGDAQDAIRLFSFRPNFTSPIDSTFTERPESPLSVAAFDPTSLNGRADITQPAPGDKLDSNSDRLNYRVAYRNYGGQESLVFNQTVRLTQEPDAFRAGVRLYELRRAGAGPFAVTEQSTIGDAVSSHWIGNAAQDHQGDLAVSFNFVSDQKKPGIHYTGRLATEPAGVFREETPLIDGTGVQKAFGWRWGDYAALTVDSVDDCTFWASGEYYTLESQNVSDFTWLSRIGKFKFDECTAAPRARITGSVTDASTGLPIVGALVTAASYSRSTSATGSYGDLLVLPGTYTVTASARGYRSQSVDLTLVDGQTAVRNFALQPVAVIENAGLQLTAESCAANGSPEPGENVTYAVTLRNAGSLNTQNLTATLLATGGVTGPGRSQNYGWLAPGGSATRSFPFTVSTSVACGGSITLTFHLQDGATDLGSVTVTMPVGAPRIAFQQNFDRTQQATLPPRWTRSESHLNPDEPLFERNWRVSTARSSSGTKAAYSKDIQYPGVNELDSPVFWISTPTARLTFQNWYELETTFLRNRLYDGSVLEISIAGGPWQDIIAAGGLFESGGYDGLIDACCSNPLAGHPGWSGRSGPNQTSEFITTAVRLPPAAAGQTVQLRWRIGTDIGNSRAVEGQYIDDLTVTDGFTCGCALQQ